MSFEIGDDIPMSAIFVDSAGAAFDPTEVRFYVKYPDASTGLPGSVTIEKSWPVDTEVVRASAGHFSMIGNSPTAGLGVYKVVGVGKASDPDFQYSTPDTRFRVRQSAFTVEPEDLSPLYWGTSSSLVTNESEVLALANSLQVNSFHRTITTAATNKYLVVSYPAAWGSAHYRFVDGGQPIAIDSAQFSVGGVLYRTDNSHFQMTFTSQGVEIY